MFILYLALLGLSVFALGVWITGSWLRQHPSKGNAEKTSRVVHSLFFAGLGAPFLIGIFRPGFTHLDELLGLTSLSPKVFFTIIGIIVLIPGLYFLGISNTLIRTVGEGANALRLTKQVVVQDVYKYTRNPMSLGYYLFSLSVGFISGSTLLTIYILLGIIPAHLFFLKYFEELELELRFGESYKEYKQNVPFLIPKLPYGSE